jgi:hypothetical protein
MQCIVFFLAEGSSRQSRSEASVCKKAAIPYAAAAERHGRETFVSPLP